MNARVGMLIGTALTAAAATWWLAAVMRALRGAADVAPLAGELLGALWLIRALAVAALGLRGTCARPAPANVIPLLAIILVPWPLVLLAWQASTARVAAVLAAEAALLAFAAGISALGAALHSLRMRGAILRPLATALGVLLAAGLWWQRAWWLAWLTT